MPPRARKAPDPMWPPARDRQPGQKLRLKMGEDTPKGKCLKDYVLGLAPVYRVACYHTHLAIHSTLKGFPDIVAIGAGDILWRELKGDGKEPTDAQYEVLDLIRAAGGNAGWWNPDDWYSGRIKREMEAISRPRPLIRRQDVHHGLNDLVDAAQERIGAGPTSGGVLVEPGHLKRDLAGYVDELVERAIAEGHNHRCEPNCPAAFPITLWRA